MMFHYGILQCSPISDNDQVYKDIYTSRESHVEYMMMMMMMMMIMMMILLTGPFSDR